jgi:hypothetical protein
MYHELRKRGTRACLHSSGPEDHSDDVDHRGEAGIGLFITCGDASERLDGAEEVLDDVAPLILFRVMRGVSSGPLAQRNHSLDVPASQTLAQPVRIERFIANEGEAADAGHEYVKACDVVTLAWQENEAHQVAKRVDERRNFCRQTPARLADGLFLSPPFAPVPCWWTRMCVASMRTYSKSGSSDKASKIRSQTPFCAQRQKRV